MTTTILILTPDDAQTLRGEGPLTERAGDLFDTGFVETVRTLSVQRLSLRVLVPWTDDLAALVSAAILDGAPAFDPERSKGDEESGSVIVPYAPGDSLKSPVESDFWASSYLSLNFDVPQDIRGYLEKSRLDHIIALGFPKRDSHLSGALRLAVERYAPRIFVFGRLISPEDAAEELRANPESVVDLSARYETESPRPETKDTPETETLLDWESSLEPYVPFGLLIQRAILDPLDARESNTEPA